MSGTVGLRFIERGSVIGPGIQVAQMTNLDHLNLYVKVTERDILGIRKGQMVSVSTDVYPSISFPGKVTNIGLKADNTFNYDVEIEVTNPKDTPLRGGMHARAAFTFGSGRTGLTIPRKAVAGSLLDGKVYVVKDSVARQRVLALGAVHGERVEVRDGLTANEWVVVAGLMSLSDGARVEIVKSN